MSRLILIDGHAIMHRAFHALPPMNNSSGQPTNAVYGFIAILLRVIEELKPTHLAVVFDRPTPTFRNKLFKEYQSQRPKTDDALISQVGVIHEVISAMQIPIFELDGYEADDVIGTIAVESTKNKKNIDEVIIVTGDRDLLQLVNNKVKLFMPVKGLSEAKMYGEAEALERMGVPPKQIVDLKALMGDPSDNYPGVAGIGPKTAIGLLNSYETLENLYKNLDSIGKDAVVEKLKTDRENAFLSQKLATVVTDAPVEFTIQQTLIPTDFLTKEVIDVFGKYEFRTLLKRLSKMSGKEIEEKKPKVEKKKVDDSQMGLF